MNPTQSQGGDLHPRKGPDLAFEPVTLPQMLSRAAGRFPKRPALVFMGKKITYRELEQQVNLFAGALQTLGVQKGDRVATLLPNMPQMVIAAYGAMRIGAVAVPLDPLAEEEDLRRQLSDAGAKTMVALDLRLPRCQAVMKRTPLRNLIVCHITDYLPFPGNKLIPHIHKGLYLKAPAEAGIHEFLPLLSRKEEGRQDESAWEAEAAILFSARRGGKGAILTQANLSCNVQQIRAWATPLKDGEESVLGVFPFFQAPGWTGIQNLAIFAGWTNILVPRPDPAVIVEIMQKSRPSLLPAPPSVLEELVRNPAFCRLDLSCLKAFLTGGEPMPGRLAEEIRKIKDCPVHVGYGLTEASALAALTPWGKTEKPGTVGTALAGTYIKIVAPETQEELPAGMTGEICLKGPQVMKGYLGGAAETDAVIRDGWLHTGDRGFFDEEGCLTLADQVPLKKEQPAKEG